ncbi:MAG: hypothetical protein HYV09_16350 [Deltaproteobacteria bacterium]|nr:hypothetical protein [Deltaproteobacteria bacterium]
MSARALLLFAIALCFAGCKAGTATPEECDEIARHLAELQVKKEKRPPLGRLAMAPFNTKEREDEIFQEAQASAKTRCTKGWKREVYECMSKATEIEEADKCRSL